MGTHDCLTFVCVEIRDSEKHSEVFRYDLSLPLSSALSLPHQIYDPTTSTLCFLLCQRWDLRSRYLLVNELSNNLSWFLQCMYETPLVEKQSDLCVWPRRNKQNFWHVSTLVWGEKCELRSVSVGNFSLSCPLSKPSFNLFEENFYFWTITLLTC